MLKGASVVSHHATAMERGRAGDAGHARSRGLLSEILCTRVMAKRTGSPASIGSADASPSSTTLTSGSLPGASGLPAWTPPPPDADGNPNCRSGIGWDDYFENGQAVGTRVSLSKNDFDLPDHFTIVVRRNDGREETQDAGVGRGATGPWDSVAEHDFLFTTLNPFDVKEVLMSNRDGRCWVFDHAV